MATDSQVQPALTAEEWADILGPEPRGSNGKPPGFLYGPDRVTDRRCHALAASCLYGQPFGFTRRDVAALRLAEQCLERDEDHRAYDLRDIADRIEALLPPDP